jgi:hypothetical protein
MAERSNTGQFEPTVARSPDLELQLGKPRAWSVGFSLERMLSDVGSWPIASVHPNASIQAQSEA